MNVEEEKDIFMLGAELLFLTLLMKVGTSEMQPVSCYLDIDSIIRVAKVHADLQ
jgi:hypothetical protein